MVFKMRPESTLIPSGILWDIGIQFKFIFECECVIVLLKESLHVMVPSALEVRFLIFRLFMKTEKSGKCNATRHSGKKLGI